MSQIFLQLQLVHEQSAHLQLLKVRRKFTKLLLQTRRINVTVANLEMIC